MGAAGFEPAKAEPSDLQSDRNVLWLSQFRMFEETKGYADDQTNAKHNSARRWVTAVNNWGQLGRWAFHVCYDPHLLKSQLAELVT